MTTPTHDKTDALVELLAELEEYFQQREDVVDGNYGKPEPNEEMNLLRKVREALATSAADAGDGEFVENYIRSLPWSPDTPDIHKTLVAGNIRGFYSHLSKSSEPIGFANLHEFNGGNDGFLVVRARKAHAINNGDTFLTVPIFATAQASRPAADSDWRIGMFDRWNTRAQELGYAGIAEAIEALPADSEAVACNDQMCDQAMKERDHAEDIIDQLCDAVLGRDREEWSSAYFFENAVEDVKDAIATLGDTCPSAAVPDGFVLVPSKANREWAEAYCARVNRHPDGEQASVCEGQWREISFRDLALGEINAMLDAAPVLATPASGSDAAHPDDAAVNRFAAAMKEKLAAARAKGRGGWNDKGDCTQQLLSDLLRGHVEKGDPRDVANFCMFLHQRAEAILPASGSCPACMGNDGDAPCAYPSEGAPGCLRDARLASGSGVE